MAKTVPFQEIAAVYDAVYAKKNYLSEVVALRRHMKPGMTVLDIGCGTGKHAALIKETNPQIIGVEPCRPMAEQALKRGIPLWCTTIQDLGTTRTFDIIIAMFDVLDYLVSDEDYDRALTNISNALKPGAMFFYEGWNADTMPSVYEKHRKLTFRYAGSTWKRTSDTATNKIFPGGDVLYSILYKYEDCFSHKKFEEIHVLHPRLGKKPDLTKYGLVMTDSVVDPYSVKAWFRKV